ncbi:hypothetical protein IKE67_09170 [bacterium]|nr:hypothetical protein [bacterium]
MKKNLLNNFILKIKEFPLWIKQVIFFYLWQDLKSQVSDNFLFMEEKDVINIYVPELSYIGKTELEERVKGLEPNVYTFLESVTEEMSIMECALNHFWTLEETCKYFLTAVDTDLIKGPVPVGIIAMSGFMAGRYRTGEYFKRIGKINVDQLEQTIRRQKELSAEGKPAKIAQIMIDLGFITEKDTKSLMVIKEEAKKRFILDTTIVPNGVTANDSKYLSEIDELKKQNNLLKAKLAKLLSMFKKQ